MYLDESLPGSGGYSGPFCLSCKGLILRSQPATRIDFAHDPDGAKGLSGEYHLTCSKPFASMASALAMMARFGR